MGGFDDTVRKIAKALRRHVDGTALEKIMDDLLDVPGDKTFRDAVETLSRELTKKMP